jgi:hypothetical protein
MPGPESNELQTYLEEIIAATRQGSIQWESANPTTFVWDTGSAIKGARLSLQLVNRIIRPIGLGGAPGSPRRVPSYILQAFEMSNGVRNLKVSINGAEDESTNRKLETLYEFIKTGVSRKGLDFLKGLIPRR